MLFSGLAGCLESESVTEESTDDSETGINLDTGNNTADNTTDNVTIIPHYGTIMTSTYHVAQLVSAIVGPTATVEMMSTSNIPVHDYKPSVKDTVRLANSDVFFYHGLNLEPWVEGTLSTLGSDAPPAYETHTMPSGELTPDYQSLLESDLCEQLAEGDRESNTLIAYENLASQLEIHLEKGVQNLTFPSADAAYLEGHDHSDEHDHADDDHSDHDNHSDHDDHGDHDSHAHVEPEKIIESPKGCSSDTVIAIFHLEEGEYTVEFETNSTDFTNFEVAALPMLGGHAHHHHDHGSHEGHDDHADHGDNEESNNHANDDHLEDGDNHTDDEHSEYPICHDAETHENIENTNQSDCEAAGNLWMEGAPNDGTRGYLTIHVENEGDYGFALPSHITANILMGEEDHDDHDDHDDHGGHEDHAGHDDETSIVADDDEEEFEYDPHSWLDPVAFKAQTKLVLNALIEQFPEGNETFSENAEKFMLELDRIHIDYSNTFGPSSTCTTNSVASNHNAYSYLTVRYGIEFVTVHGLDPEGEPSVADIQKVIEKIEEDEISVLYIEEYTQKSAVSSIVQETNVEVLYLYTMEMSPSDSSDNYLTMMNKNLDNLKIGMGCTV